MLVSIPQFMAAAGICAGYFTCYGSVNINSSISWRLPFILMAITGMMLAISCSYLPPSPRWLLVHDRREDAIRSLARLEISRQEVEKDMSKLTARGDSKVSFWQAIRSIFQEKYRLRTILGLFVLGMVQLSGIDGVLYVSGQQVTQPMTIAEVVTVPVCSYAVRSSWSFQQHSFVPSFWGFGYSHAGNFDPGFPLRRQMGSQSLHHYWWRRFVGLHVHYRQSLRNQQCSRQIRLWQMVCHFPNLCLRSSILCNMGYCWQDIR